MKIFYSFTVALCILLLVNTETKGQCTGVNLQYDLNVTCTEQLRTGVSHGNYQRIPVVSGRQYRFRTTGSVGNTTLSGRVSNGSGTGKFYRNSNNSGDDEDYTWTSDFTGILAVIVRANGCGWISSSALLYYRCVNCTTGEWNGAWNTDWYQTRNWGCGTLPGSGTNVTIPNSAIRDPSINSGNAYCNTITIESSRTVNLNSSNGARLNITQ